MLGITIAWIISTAIPVHAENIIDQQIFSHQENLSTYSSNVNDYFSVGAFNASFSDVAMRINSSNTLYANIHFEGEGLTAGNPSVPSDCKLIPTDGITTFHWSTPIATTNIATLYVVIFYYNSSSCSTVPTTGTTYDVKGIAPHLTGYSQFQHQESGSYTSKDFTPFIVAGTSLTIGNLTINSPESNSTIPTGSTTFSGQCPTNGSGSLALFRNQQANFNALVDESFIIDCNGYSWTTTEDIVNDPYQEWFIVDKQILTVDPNGDSRLLWASSPSNLLVHAATYTSD